MEAEPHFIIVFHCKIHTYCTVIDTCKMCIYMFKGIVHYEASVFMVVDTGSLFKLFFEDVWQRHGLDRRPPVRAFVGLLLWTATGRRVLGLIFFAGRNG